MLAAIAKSMNGTGNYTQVAGGWYTITKGYYSPTEYYFEFYVPNTYNANIGITLTSFNTMIA